MVHAGSCAGRVRRATSFIVGAVLLGFVSIAGVTSAATIAFPDITVTSVGQRDSGGNSLSGLDTGMGSFAGSGFAGAVVTAGDTLQLTINPAAGMRFSLTPGYTTLQLLFRFGSGSASIFPAGTVTFDNIAGGTFGPLASSGNLMSSSWVDFGNFSSSQPSAPITFDSITMIFVAPSDITLNPLASTAVTYLRSFAPLGDTTQYVDLVPLPIPEPSTGLLFGMGLTGLVYGRTRRRAAAAAASRADS